VCVCVCVCVCKFNNAIYVVILWIAMVTLASFLRRKLKIQELRRVHQQFILAQNTSPSILRAFASLRLGSK